MLNRYISFNAPVAGYLLKPDALLDGPPEILFKRKLDADLVEPSVRAQLCVRLNCNIPEVQYGDEARFMLVPSGADHQTGKETAKDQECRENAEKLGLKDMKWVYLPMAYVHFW
ncbi:hypothetical protein BN14_10749 [Rhizoctonia solani AG-1 IB]|uniref:Uncharacterized protein n=1 Tax=Thanatephorus cucumeris (strain AG1-IB / isolate 7/3/14) TaxID=1108050 RepID=M5C9D9_THACB|nr:hypothetical protein BN14_10749 [Rhizoctonia solani AG-1 IB]